MYLYILFGLLAVLAVLVVVVSMRPTDFRVSRSTKIAAPPATVFAQVNDFHKWEAWSPWAKIDPDSKSEFSGPPSGKDAHFQWSGNNKVGEGAMTIVDSRPPNRIGIKLEFIRPFKATNDVEFIFKPEGGQTVVNWSMAGKNNFMSKAVGLFMDCEKMVGGQFEQGLASMKSVSEAANR
jgi:uncharacterized protein YndB with AHSA1/START domain